MKTILALPLAGIWLLAASCHRQDATTVLSCCAKEGTAKERSAKENRDGSSLASDPLTGTASIYQLPGAWTDQHDQPYYLGQLKGKVQIMAMIFTHCGYACPRLVNDMKAIQESLPTAEKKEVGFVLVSFDSDRDDPAQLRRFAIEQGLDSQWVLLHGNAGQVRELSLLLNLRYQRLAGGDFSHSNAIFILDRQGAISQTLDGLGSRTALAVPVIDRLAGRSEGSEMRRLE